MSGDDRHTDAARPCRPTLFVSYTRTDLERARLLIEALGEAGFDVWWDGLIEGGVDYLPTIESALLSADCVVVLWSKSSVDSNWVRDEAEMGRDRGRLVPVTLDGTIAPLGFRQMQMIDLRGWTGENDAPEIQRIRSAVDIAIKGEQAGRRSVSVDHGCQRFDRVPVAFHRCNCGIDFERHLGCYPAFLIYPAVGRREDLVGKF